MNEKNFNKFNNIGKEKNPLKMAIFIYSLFKKDNYVQSKHKSKEYSYSDKIDVYILFFNMVLGSVHYWNDNEQKKFKNKLKELCNIKNILEINNNKNSFALVVFYSFFYSVIR